MKKIIIGLFSLFMAASTFAQQAAADKPSRAERKEARQEAMVEKQAAIASLIDSQSFVIEANTFQDRYGNIVNLAPSLNFIALQDGEATVQIVFPNNAGLGYNGLGGITLEGELVKLEKFTDEKGYDNQFAMRTFGSSLISGDIRVTVTPSGYATVQFSNMQGGRFTLRGVFRDIENSLIFKGAVAN